MAVLAGHLQIAAYVLLATVLYAAARWLHGLLRCRGRGMLWLLVAGLTAGLPASVQLLPGLELAKLSPRGGAQADPGLFGFHKRFALQPAELLTFVSPDALGHPVRGDYPLFSYGERAGFAGISALLLAMLGLVLSGRWWRWAFLAMAALSVWAAMAGPPALLIFRLVPGVGLAGGFVRLLFLYTFALSVLAALGLDAVVSRLANARSDLARLAPVAVSLSLIVLCAELVGWGWMTVPRAPADRLYPETQLTRRLEQESAPGERLLAVTRRDDWTLLQRPRALMPPNSASAYPGLESIQGYDSLYPRASLTLAALVEDGATPSPEANGNMVLLENAGSPLLRLAGVRRVLRDAGSARGEDVVNGVRIALQADPLPRAFVTRLPVEDTRRGARILTRLATSQPSEAVRITSLEPGAVGVAIPALPQGRRLVITNTAYPGWRAWQDGKALPIHCVGGVFQSLTLNPGGGGRVFLAYWPGTVLVGLFLYLLGAGTLAGLLAFEYFRRRDMRQTEPGIG